MFEIKDEIGEISIRGRKTSSGRRTHEIHPGTVIDRNARVLQFEYFVSARLSGDRQKARGPWDASRPPLGGILDRQKTSQSDVILIDDDMPAKKSYSQSIPSRYSSQSRLDSRKRVGDDLSFDPRMPPPNYGSLPPPKMPVPPPTTG